jgi:hypothetical protein
MRVNAIPLGPGPKTLFGKRYDDMSCAYRCWGRDRMVGFPTWHAGVPPARPRVKGGYHAV